MFRRFPVREEYLGGSREAAMAVASEPGVVAFLGGAPMAGLGTPQSDVDLFVLETRDRGPGPARQFVVDDLRIDVEYFPFERFASDVRRCSSYTVTEQDNSLIGYGTRTVLDPLVRLMHGEIIIDDGRLLELQEHLRANADDVGRLVAARHSTEVQNDIEDIEGFIAVDAIEPARLVAQWAVLSGARAMLAAFGDHYIGEKWLWSQWDRTLRDQVPKELTARVLALGSTDTGRVGVFDRVWLAQDLVAMAGNRRVHPVVGTDDLGPVVRNPYTVPIVMTSNVLFYRPGKSTVKVSHSGMVLWALSHGHPRADAVDLTVAMLADSGIEVTAQAVDAYYGSLLAAGLLIRREDVL